MSNMTSQVETTLRPCGPSTIQATSRKPVHKYATAMQAKKLAAGLVDDRPRWARAQYRNDPSFPKLPPSAKISKFSSLEASTRTEISGSQADFEEKIKPLLPLVSDSELRDADRPDFFEKQSERLYKLHDAICLVHETHPKDSPRVTNELVLMNIIENMFEDLYEDADTEGYETEQDDDNEEEELLIFMAKLVRVELEYASWTELVVAQREQLAKPKLINAWAPT